MNQTITDIVGLCALFASLLFKPEVASVVAPYLTIIIGSSVGAGFALKRREKLSRIGAIWYFSRVVGLALLVSIPIAIWLESKFPGLAVRITIAPIALLVGTVGDDWPELASKIKEMIFRLIDRRGQQQ